MENNSWKFGIFGILVLIIMVGGFILMKQSFPQNNTTNIIKTVANKKDKDIRLDKDKDYIYFENSETIAHDLDIEYKDVVINFNDKENIQGKLNDETKKYKSEVVYDNELEEADFDNVVSATYKTTEYYVFENYISLVVNYYTFDREELISFVDTDTYIFDKTTGNRISEDELLSKFNLTKNAVNEKIIDYVDGQNLLSEAELDLDATIEAIDDYALFVDRVGRLSISILVKSDQKDYNEVVVLS